MTFPTPHLTVFYEHLPEGANALLFGHALFSRLKRAHLNILLAQNDALGEANELQTTRVRRHVEKITGIASEQMSVRCIRGPYTDFDLNRDLVVTSYPRDDVDQVNCLVTFDETKLGAGPLVLPFGSGESGYAASQAALNLAALLGLEVSLYHTTWKVKDKDESQPREHMCKEALLLLSWLESEATRRGLKFRSTIEVADDVSEGFVQFALREGASVIGMARGLNTGRAGSYVTRALESSPIPILIAGRSLGGKP